MCSVIAIQILDAVLFSSGNQNLPQSDQALIKRDKPNFFCGFSVIKNKRHRLLFVGVRVPAVRASDRTSVEVYYVSDCNDQEALSSGCK